MTIINITRAVRQGSHVIISMTGPSGSGKTYSSILMARGMAGPEGKVGFLDTETGRGRLYADVAGGFDYAELTPPFSPDRYIEAIDVFEKAGYPVLIIDSASHEFEGIGGICEMAERSGRKDYGKWAAPKAAHKKFMNRILSARMHIILCCRARQPIKEVETPSGKKEVVVGDWKEIQEKNFIYEVTVSVLLRPDGTKKVTKCPDGLLPAFAGDGRITLDSGKMIAQWVAGGVPVDHELEALRRHAEEQADKGSDPFRQYWAGLAAGERAKLKPYIPNLQSIAKAADDAAAEELRQRQSGGDDFPGDRPAREVA